MVSMKPKPGSQRTNNFKGGIQAGTTASNMMSRSLDSRLLESAHLLNRTQPGITATWCKSLDAVDLSNRLGVPESHVVGVAPDGGIWFKPDGKRQLVLAAEAKKQGAKGNAIERWYKNWATLSHLKIGVYLTVCTGEGFFGNNSAQRIMETALALEADGPERIRDNTIWNHPGGRLWLYRYREVPDASTLRDLLSDALAHGTDRLP